MIGIDIDVRSDNAEGEEAEVFVKAQGSLILSSENPSLALAYKIEAVVSLLRDIESDFGMLSFELREDNNRVICEALQRRVKGYTDELEANLTQHTMTANSVLETFGYMWSNDYKETLFLPAFRMAVIEAGDGHDLITQELLDEELALLKKANGITESLEGETPLMECDSVFPQREGIARRLERFGLRDSDAPSNGADKFVTTFEEAMQTVKARRSGEGK